jgi:hypothetical protein
MAATTDVIEMFKYTYAAERLSYLAALEVVIWRILSRVKKRVGGRGQWILPVQTKNTGVFIGHTEGGAISTSRAQPDTQEATFALQEFHGVWDISWKMMRDSQRDEDSFARGVDFMDKSQRRRVFRLLNADFCTFGKGELGILSAADDATQITVRSLPFVDLGMLVDLVDASDDNALVGPDNTAVTAIDVPNRAVTTGTAGSGTAAGDYFTVGNSVSSSGSLHMLGLLAWAASANPATVVGNIGGINRSTAGNEYWQATVLGNSGTTRPFTEDLGLEALDVCVERGGVTFSDWICNRRILRRYHESLRSDTFFALGAVKAFGDNVGVGRSEESMRTGENSMGETPYQLSNIPFRAEMFFDSSTIVGLNREHLFLGYDGNEVPRPISEVFDDMVPFFNLPTTPAAKFEVLSYWEGEMIGDNPASLVAIQDLAES